MDPREERPAGPVAPEIVRIGLFLALLLALPALLLLVLVPRDSAEFTISLVTLGLGGVLLLFVLLLAWLAGRR